MAKTLTPEAAGRELARVLKVVSREREKLADEVKERKGRIAKMEDRARELVDIANGTAYQVELDTGEDEEPPAACGPAEVARIIDPRRRPKKGKKKADDAAEVRALAVAHAQKVHPNAPWLAELVASPHAPLFVPGEWWPDVGLDGKLMHDTVKGRCPNGVEDWRDCPTCLAAASAGPEASR